MDGSGLTFTQRLTYGDFTKGSLLEYYAIADSPLHSDNITVAESEFGQPCCSPLLQVVAIHGANTRTIFDSNGSMPVTCSGTACGNCTVNFNQGTCSVSIQTSSIDFVIAATAINDAQACGSQDFPGGHPPGVPGFTTVTTSPGYGSMFEFDYRKTTVPHDTITFNCSGTDVEGILLDAVSLRPLTPTS
jgi:hypothetical protein